MKDIRPHHLFDAVVWTVGAMFLVVLAVHEAHAGERVYDNANATYRAECGSCHVAYPPELLPPASWDRVLATLDRHYGTDAGVDAPTLRATREFVNTRVGDRRRVDPAASADELPRITTSRWFIKEHRKVAPRWTDPKVRSATNCGACHTQAPQGNYSEATLRLPR